jgi:hypothetical protein
MRILFSSGSGHSVFTTYIFRGRFCLGIEDGGLLSTVLVALSTLFSTVACSRLQYCTSCAISSEHDTRCQVCYVFSNHPPANRCRLSSISATHAFSEAISTELVCEVSLGARFEAANRCRTFFPVPVDFLRRAIYSYSCSGGTSSFFVWP